MIGFGSHQAQTFSQLPSDKLRFLPTSVWQPQGYIFPALKQINCEYDHTMLANIEYGYAWSYTSIQTPVNSTFQSAYFTGWCESVTEKAMSWSISRE
jgi:hypothetical protein